VALLIEQIEYVLGLNQRRAVCLVGVGNLGHALAGYAGFASRGFRIVALFDAAPAKVGERINGLTVRHIDELARVAAVEQIAIGVIATPAGAAQTVADALVAAGVTSILNFAPCVPVGARERRRTQGRSRHRAADPVVPRASQGVVDGAAGRTLLGRPVRGETGGGRVVNLLSVGASYRTADVSTLERLAIADGALPLVLQRLIAQPYVGEAVVLSTCNRVEVYAAVSGFHGGLGDVCNVLAEQSGMPVVELARHLYVHYDEAAVRHSFRVSAGARLHGRR
jgi:hypothetical protein